VVRRNFQVAVGRFKGADLRALTVDNCYEVLILDVVIKACPWQVSFQGFRLEKQKITRFYRGELYVER
jgi:hypothetical protein